MAGDAERLELDAVGRTVAISNPSKVMFPDGAVATGTRRSETLGTDLLFVAVPVASGGAVQGAVRASVPTSRLDALVRRYWLILGGVGLVVLAAVAVAGLWLARWVSRPLTDLRDATRRAEAGDLSVRADAGEGPEEVRELASAFNDMVGRLDQLVGTQEKFVADASHQLRSPLTALRLRIENLQHDAAGAATADDLEGALGEVDRLSRLVNGLLARPGPSAARRSARPRTSAPWCASGRTPGGPRPPSARRPAGRRAPRPGGGARPRRPRAGGRQPRRQRAGGRAGRLCGNPRSRPRRRRARGVRDGSRPGDDARGPGPRLRPLLARARGPPGSGLGLAIVKSLVEADEGTVRLEEAPGGGLRAVVALPAGAPTPVRPR